MPFTRPALSALAASLALTLGAACSPDPEPEREPDGGGASSQAGSEGTQPEPPLGRVATTQAGEVRGLEGGGLRAWLGVPYAAPPVGELRWREPRPVEPWEEPRAATRPALACLQAGPGGVRPGSAEDCLYLNVYRPANDERDLPVLVNIHGGGLVNGTGLLPPNAVKPMVDHGIVVVSMNYRLGRLGYLAHPALAAEAEARGEQPVANFGLLDQIAALEWVRDNIEAFGGDPEQVTIHGMSAGGASVNYLMLSPRAEGLFDGAIARSGLGGERPPPYAVAARAGEQIAADLGAPGADAAQLRALDGATVAQAPAEMLLNELPIRDPVLPVSPAEGFQQGQEADVPYLVGTTDRELIERHFLALGVDPQSRLDDLLDDGQGRAVSVYGSEDATATHLLNDLFLTAPARTLAVEHAQRSPSYRYRFSIASPAIRATYGGAIHASDLYYAFGVGDPDLPGSNRLARQMSRCFASFVVAGRPDCGVPWPEAGTGGLVEFTNRGPVTRRRDPWAARLDLVENLRP